MTPQAPRTRNSTESSVFGESGFASNKAQRFNCPCRLEGFSFRLRSQNFACETFSFRASRLPRECLKSLVAKRLQNPSRFAVMLRSILFRSFLRDVSVRLMGATFDLYLSRKIKLSRFSFSENETPSEDCSDARISIKCTLTPAWTSSRAGVPAESAISLTLIRRFHGSAYMSQLLANRAGPYAHTHSAAARILPHHRRTALYTACRFQLLANRVGPYAHMPSAGPNNLAHRS